MHPLLNTIVLKINFMNNIYQINQNIYEHLALIFPEIQRPFQKKAIRYI